MTHYSPKCAVTPVLLATLLACAPRHPTPAELRPPPPVAEQRLFVHTEHGVERPDPYAWLRDREDPATLAYLEAENAYTEAMTRHLETLRRDLAREMESRYAETDETAPVRHGDWLYYQRTAASLNYPIHLRRQEGGPDAVILDENALGLGKDYLDVAIMETSPDHRLLAYGYDDSGAEQYTIRFRNLESGQDLPGEIVEAYDALAWANDNRTVFYTTLDETLRPYRVWRHALGTDQEEDDLVYQEDDARFHLALERSRSGRFLLIESESAVTTEVRVLELDQPDSAPRILVPRKQGVEVEIDHSGDHYYAVTNDDGSVGFRLLSLPLDADSLDDGTELIAARDEVTIESVDAFADHIVLWEREDGLPQLRIRRISTGEEHRVELPEAAYSLWGEWNPEFESTRYRFGYESLITPYTVFSWDMEARGRTLLDEEPVLGGYDRSLYEMVRTSATAADGTEIPISLVHRKGIAKDGSHPLFLVAYGAYGSSYDPEFSAPWLSLLERDVILAIAHVRGGGEGGRAWKDQGKLFNKRSTFTDFIASAEHLVEEGYTSPAHLAIWSVSAGGLLIGNVINERPDLFAVAVADVPFVDAVTTMLDASIPLTTTEWEEWGNPQDRAAFDYLRSYSPYDNVRPQAYPALLVTAGFNDPRVGYWEPAKWVARLRATRTDDKLLLLKTHMGAGHGGASGRLGEIEDEAFMIAFLLDRLGQATAEAGKNLAPPN